jgi:Zn-dependent protease with chaperone function
MNARDPFTVSARYFDGQTAGDSPVTVVVDPAGGWVTIRAPRDDGREKLITTWRLDELRIIRDSGAADGVVFHPVAEEEARLIITNRDDAARLVDAAPASHKITVERGTWRKVIIWSTSAALAIYLLLGHILPGLADRMATFISPEQEERIGETVIAQANWLLGTDRTNPFCSTPDGDAAMAKMTDRLSAELDLPYALKVQIVRNPLINAFAAPGGHIVFFSALLDEADTPEEVAAVLAHEIGHVAARDSLRLVLRAAGSTGILSMVLGDVGGGIVIAAAADQLMQASYTREAESQADDFALALLADAGLPAEGLAAFFEKLEAKYGSQPDFLAYFASHPELHTRAENARDKETRKVGFKPVLSDTEWQALKNICS